MEVPQKIKIEPPYDLAVLLLGIYLEKMTLTQKDICILMFTAALFTMAKIWEQSARGMGKEDVVYTHTHTHTQRNIIQL